MTIEPAIAMDRCVVAMVIDEKRLVITGGRKAGHVPGHRFEIHPPEVRHVFDPDTEEYLGRIQICDVVATEIHDLCTVCELVRVHTSDYVRIGGRVLAIK